MTQSKGVRFEGGGDPAQIASALREAVCNAVTEVVAKAGLDAAEEARTNHTYQNRTGHLEASTHAGIVVRDGDVITAFVEADAEYASFVEDKMPFMAPAIEKIEQAMTDALTKALEGI